MFKKAIFFYVIGDPKVVVFLCFFTFCVISLGVQNGYLVFRFFISGKHVCLPSDFCAPEVLRVGVILCPYCARGAASGPRPWSGSAYGVRVPRAPAGSADDDSRPAPSGRRGRASR